MSPQHELLFALITPYIPAGEMAHDLDHLLRVRTWAMRLAPEAGADVELAGATALVHDLVFVAKDSPDRALGGELSAAAAPAVLAAAGYTADEITQIAEAVRTSSWSRGLVPTNALGVILQDADRLDALGAIGLLRTATCGQFMSRADRPGRFYDPLDPLARHGRVVDDRRQVVDHLHAKLLLLHQGMHLPMARAEAARRHQWLHGFLDELTTELL